MTYKTVLFPDNVADGSLVTCDPGSTPKRVREWGQPWGAIRIPSHHRLYFSAERFRIATDLAFLQGMRPSDFAGLNLDYSELDDKQLNFVGRLTELLELSFHKQNITDAGLKHLAGLKLLESLGLDGTKVTDEGMEIIGAFTRLKSLSLDETSVTDRGVVRLSGLTNLEKFSLTATQVNDDGLQILSGMPRLKDLCVSDTNVNGSSFRWLPDKLLKLSAGILKLDEGNISHLSRLKYLQQLDLSCNDLTKKGISYVSGLSTLTNLTLTDTGIDDDGVSLLEPLKYLRTLSLQHCAVTGEGFKVMSGGRLSKLHVSSASVTIDGARAIGQLKGLRYLMLKKADLINEIVDVLPQSIRLEALNVSSSPFNDHACISLKKFRNLRQIWATDTSITEASLDVLRFLPKLTRFVSSRSVFDDDLVAHYRRRFPKCRIQYAGPEGSMSSNAN